jgi:hypothetical protein
MEKQGPARGTERQGSQFVEDHEGQPGHCLGEVSGLAFGLFLFEGVDQFDVREKPRRKRISIALLLSVVEPPVGGHPVMCRHTSDELRMQHGNVARLALTDDVATPIPFELIKPELRNSMKSSVFSMALLGTLSLPAITTPRATASSKRGLPPTRFPYGTCGV